uniref:Butyrophilin subfamily 3 member A3-like n=1 Tax=Labrus bergylta TaxID=56723 RepID=A0A3Q3FFB3_9LABR|nr:butyrophilin subfamily 3 member A3-like [Labrus bergylta]
MSGIKRVMFFNVLFYLKGFAKGGAADVKTVFCGIEENCTLPCTFPTGEDVVISWKETTTKEILLHYYNNQDHPKNKAQRFSGRTSLSSEKEASLCLTGVTVQDEGRYECYVSIPDSPAKQSTMDLKVDAPPRKVNIQQVGNRITCSSEGIYPQPELTWSSSPPTNLTVADTPTVHQKEKLYSINSSLTALNVSNLDYSCTISTGRNKRRATLSKPAFINIFNTETTISCNQNITNTSPTDFTWRFNHSEVILNRTTAKDSYTVPAEWRVYLKSVSTSGSLILKDLTSDQEGIYTCEVNTAKETFVTNTFLKVLKDTSVNIAAIAGSVIGACLFLAAIIFLLWFFFRNGQGYRTVMLRMENRQDNN